MKKWSMVFVATLTATALVGCNQDEPQGETNQSPDTTNGGEQGDSTNNSNEMDDLGVYIDLNVALQEFEDAYPDASLTSVEFDTRAMLYEFEGMDDDTEYEMDIDATTQEITHQREEALDADDAGGVEREEEGFSFEGLITPDEAVNLAREEVAGELRSWALDRDNSRTIYDVTMDVEGNEHEVKIDAETSEIIEVDKD
ncbi:lipoprotein [Bacillus sp. JCM 19046]|nr:lipoprotein [Bacillus sp. JCM 19045]GAF15640.1 lipoprotein [Bacillus sp. JCM 19046]